MFVLQLLPQELIERIRRWDQLKRWERREIGQALRMMGLSYREIAAVIPVHKGTLSGWCRDLGVSWVHRRQIAQRRSSVGALLRQRAVDRVSAIRRRAQAEADELISDPHWVAGVVAYWSEGSKRSNELSFSNSDPSLVKLFVVWTQAYLGVPPNEVTAKLHLHSGQDEGERLRCWAEVTGIPLENFRKTFVKPEGTGHRKNRLYNGTVLIRVPRSSALLHRVSGWTDAVAARYASLDYTAAGR